MRHILSTAIVLSALAFSPVVLPRAAHASPDVPGTGDVDLADLSAKLLPSVVNISSTQKLVKGEDFPEMPHFPPGSPFEDFFNEFMKQYGDEMPQVAPSSLGSGFIIDADKGIVITNNHVVRDADEVRVTFHDDATVVAEVLGRDEKMDIAVLKVKMDKKYPAVPFGDSDKMRVGNWVLAIGNPFGLGGTVTAGIVSAQQRDIHAGPYDDFIQTDASINRGNSGGPMFNLQGEVIGINTAIFSPTGGSVGIGFAIPSNMIKPVIGQLIEFGHTRRGWLGVRIQSVTPEIAESLGLPGARGALVASTTAGGPAEKAGLLAGDIILSFDGKDITQMRSLPRTVAETAIGTKAVVKYWRDGKEGTTTVEVGELEKAEQDGLLGEKDSPLGSAPGTVKGTLLPNVGVTLSDISAQDREQHKIPDDVKGALVTKVETMSEAAQKGLMPGDVIVEINQQPAATPKEAADIIRKAESGGRNSVLLLVNREGDVRFVALKLNNKK
ncbi:MAG TPA: DegQ family serine endoprotease [Alphaproteobacteria bacterium]|jgi:serine protease Do